MPRDTDPLAHDIRRAIVGLTEDGRLPPGPALAALRDASGISWARLAHVVLVARVDSTLRRWRQTGLPPDVHRWLTTTLRSVTRDGDDLVIRCYAPLLPRGRPPGPPKGP